MSHEDILLPSGNLTSKKQFSCASVLLNNFIPVFPILCRQKNKITTEYYYLPCMFCYITPQRFGHFCFKLLSYYHGITKVFNS